MSGGSGGPFSETKLILQPLRGLLGLLMRGLAFKTPTSGQQSHVVDPGAAAKSADCGEEQVNHHVSS